MKRKRKLTPEMKERIEHKKSVVAVYLILRFLVLLTLVWELYRQDYENAFVCVLTLILFLVPSFIERRLRIELPNALEIVILVFIFAADILGEIQEYYVLIPHWDTVLHTINGFLFAAIGFCIVNIFNENKRISMTLSPIYMAIAAFCFSMTIGVLWEFFEWAMDCWFAFDMQKDTVLQGISSVKIHPMGRNEPVVLKEISDTIVVFADGSQQSLSIGGYLDIGLQDTMKDLLVNLVGAVVFSVIGYFYVKTKGEGRIARMFIPEVKEEKR